MTPDGLFRYLSSVSCGAFVLATDQTVVFWNRRAREILGYTPDRVVGRRCSGVARGVDEITLTDDCEEGCLMLRSLRAGLVPGCARLRMRCSWGERKWLVVTPMVVSGVEDGGPLLVYLFGDSDEGAASVGIQRLVELGGGAGGGSDEARYVRPRAFLTDPREEVVGADDEELLLRMYEALADDEGQSLRMRRDRAFGESPEDLEERIRRAVFRSPRPRSGEGAGSDKGQLAEPEPRAVRLTEREREVLSYLALGWETKYIAEELGVSWYTARNHIENLRRKLGASTRLEAVMTAMRLGILPSE